MNVTMATPSKKMAAPSVDSNPSSTTIATTTTAAGTAAADVTEDWRSDVGTVRPANPNTNTSNAAPPQYTWTERTGHTPQPDAQLKEKSKLSQFLLKFQSPAVRQADKKRELMKLEEKRTGVRKYRQGGTPEGSAAGVGYGAAGGF